MLFKTLTTTSQSHHRTNLRSTETNKPVRGVDAQDAGELGQRSGKSQLVPGPGDMAVAEVLDVVVNPRSHSHPTAAGGDDPVVSAGPELADIQTVVGEAPVDRYQELLRSVPQQPLQQPGHSFALRLVAHRRLDVLQSGKLKGSGRTEAVENDHKDG